MLVKAKGIVLRQIKYSESSLVVRIYTDELGLVSYIVSGVRSAKSKSKASLLQPLTVLDLVAYQRASKDLQRLKEYKRDFIYQSIPFDTIKSTISMYLLEVLNASIKEQEANPDMFAFIMQGLHYLDKVPKVSPLFHLAFVAKLSGPLGFQPYGEFASASPYFDLQEGTFSNEVPLHDFYLRPDMAELFGRLLSTPYEELAAMPTSRPQRKKLMEELETYYRLHIEGFRELRSPKVLEAVLS